MRFRRGWGTDKREYERGKIKVQKVRERKGGRHAHKSIVLLLNQAGHSQYTAVVVLVVMWKNCWNEIKRFLRQQRKMLLISQRRISTEMKAGIH